MPGVTAIGFGVFLGLIAGAYFGQRLLAAPALGALAGGLIGAGLGALLDRARRR